MINHITIQEASEISKKSIQTIRRAIKAKKITTRKKKTPQGFIYLVGYESLCKTYRIPMKKTEAKKEEVKTESVKKTAKKSANNSVEKEVSTKSKDIAISTDDFKKFTQTLDRLVSQHSEERQNFLRLVSSLQDKIFALENKLNLLAAPEKKWFHFWK